MQIELIHRSWLPVLCRLTLAAAAAAGSSQSIADNIVIGQVGPLSGLDAAQGRAYGEGMELYFQHVNGSGGVNGHRFTLVRRDDGGRPDDTVALTKELLAHEKPLVLTGYSGKENVAKLIASKALEKERIPVVGYRSWGIGPEAQYLYRVRAGLRDEITKIADHLGTVGITRLGLLYEAGPDSSNIVAAVEQAASSANLHLMAQASYPADTAKVKSAVQAFLATPPQAILLVGSCAAVTAFIEQYRASGGIAQMFTHSGADVEQMSRRLSEEQLRGVAIAQVTPSPYGISSKASKELNDLATARDEGAVASVSYSMMEGFIAARVIVEAVRRQGRSPSRAGTFAALDAMKNYDVGGYVVNFAPDMHTGSRRVELSIVSAAGKIRQ